MKPVSNNINNRAEFMRHQNRKADVSGFTNRQNSQVSFGSGIDFGKLASKASEIINGSTKTLTKENCELINKVIGDNFFFEKLKKCGYKLDGSSIDIKQGKLTEDLLSTIKDIFSGFWLDIAAAIVKEPKKGGILAKHIEKVNLEKDKELLFNIASSFDKNNPEKFVNSVAHNITQITKNYKSRDERTLNRMLTATVSALYSSNDFFNISMLQKDDKNEANKAKNMRLKQELFRMGLSAGLTFITMGALDKHIKNNMYLSAASIAASSLISEIVSRLLSKTPLAPLTPEKAKYISEKLNEKKQAKTDTKPILNADKDKNNNTAGKVSFSSNIDKNIFKDFASEDGSFLPIDLLNKNNEVNPVPNNNKTDKHSNKHGILKGILGAFGIASAIYFLAHKTSPGKSVASALKKAEDFIKYKTTIVEGAELEKFKNKISQFSSDKEISEIMDEYSSMLKNQDKIKIKSERFIIEGLYSGVTKIFKTMYTLLSMPAKLIDSKIITRVKESAAENTEKLAKKNNKALSALYNIFEENKGDNEKITEAIKNRTRNFEQCVETGDLANFSRTLVTVISSYFFVNDYRNKVLIESSGKDTEGASAETKQRLLHKLANFIINGTIMNVGNSLFRNSLNGNLAAAGLIAIGEETVNEALVRTSTCQPILRKNSKQEIIDFEEKQLNKKGFMGKWSRFFRKITGKKTLSQKAGLDKNKTNKTTKA